ncbi:MAG: 2,3-bisphosphoglycerate-independent phosphoglycerate mutase [Sediminibacterium sp.]|nr:2,3-bisphosphoglycerate-independent phosphoglycerate mutase [Sediminibacterium sp.]
MKKTILIIMDGWGIGNKQKSDAVFNANTPFVDSLYNTYPNTTLVTCGEKVGLPAGQMGNSEVGHLNIGAGRIVYQELQRINVAIENNSFQTNEHLLNSIHYAKQHNKPLHLMGLVSNGGVHAHINHLKAICNVCKQHNLTEVFIHCFTDGRDTDPKSAILFLQEVENFLKTSVGKIATIIGRYYAMDRDNRWERIELAYNALVNGIGDKTNNPMNALKQNYQNNITDEFIKPIIVCNENNQQPIATIKKDDAVICFNFRTDRCREITQVLTQHAIPNFSMQPLQLHFTTMTNYDDTFKNIHIIFEQDNLNNTIGEIIAKNNLQQIRIAETEKYPHVTFFFNGGREIPFEGEERMMVPSPKVATYDLKPAMSANELTEKLLPKLNEGKASFICINFANADMVGHTGVYKAVIEAVETVDKNVQKLLKPH